MKISDALWFVGVSLGAIVLAVFVLSLFFVVTFEWKTRGK